ncbi:hypothetical protein B0H14DRAFT_2621397 [Mycena olivaceomarginata]|nr:hypothetical protein B0H14DRAFT_2621397 [Mycena olivaceomarginata]
MLMARKKGHRYEAAARGRRGRHLTTVTVEYDLEDPRYDEETRWTGGVNHYLSDAESRWETESSDVESNLDTELRPPLDHSSSEPRTRALIQSWSWSHWIWRTSQL